MVGREADAASGQIVGNELDGGDSVAADADASVARLAAAAGSARAAGGSPQPPFGGADPRTILALQRTAGNVAVQRMIAPSLAAAWVARQGVTATASPYDQVVKALNDKTRFIAPQGDLKKAYGILNSLNMVGILETMEKLRGSGHLAVLQNNPSAADRFNKPRLMVAMRAVFLRAAGVKANEAQKLAADVAALPAEQQTDIERFLGLPQGGLTDPNAGMTRPDAAAQATIAGELDPGGSGVGGVLLPWDGAGATPQAAANRAKLKQELLKALKEHLQKRMVLINKVAAAPRLPMTSFEGAGRAAKRFADAAFGGLASAAALTTSQESGRASFDFKAGVNLFDQSDPGVRTPDPADLASWMAESDPKASALQQKHHLVKSRSPDKEFLRDEVLKPFVAANTPDLTKYDRFGFATADPDEHKVYAQPGMLGDTKAPSPGVPSPAERRAHWAMWETLVHEYIHVLEHPAFGDASKGRRVMKEGFCELFTKEVLTKAIPVAQSDGDPGLRGDVEGKDSGGALFPKFEKAFVPDYNPGIYADYLQHAEKIRDTTSPAAVKSAFFQGHVELIGLQPDGDMASPVAVGDQDLIKVPSSVKSFFALAAITGSTSAAIGAANPGVPSGGPLPAQLHVPGCRNHTVVEATQRRPTGGVMASKVETKAQIAKQNGVGEAELVRANPDVDWTKLKAGDRVVIPAH